MDVINDASNSGGYKKCQNMEKTFTSAKTAVGKSLILKRELPNASQYKGIFMVLPTRKFMKI